VGFQSMIARDLEVGLSFATVAGGRVSGVKRDWRETLEKREAGVRLCRFMEDSNKEGGWTIYPDRMRCLGEHKGRGATFMWGEEGKQIGNQGEDVEEGARNSETGGPLGARSW